MIALYGFLFTAFSELSEHAKEDRFKGWPDWWNTSKSWVNKYRWGSKYLPFLPEKFSKYLFFSPLVWLTDAEHFFQTLSTIAVLLTILASQGNLESVLWFYGGTVLGGLVKEIFFKNIQ